MLVWLVAAIGGLSLATHYETQRFCLGDAPKSVCAGCTANDVAFASVNLVGAARSSTIGQSVNMAVNVLWTSQTAAQRYQVAAYIALDGGNALHGTCYPYYLHGSGGNNGVSSSSNALSLIGNSTSSANNGPFPDLDGDQCGDINTGQQIWQTITNVTLSSRDSNGDGVADFNYCMGWANNINTKGCSNITSASCSTASKCVCATINIQGLSVCASQQQPCFGNDGQEATFPCEPAWSAKVKITTSATSAAFPPLSILYANAYLSYQSPSERLGLEYYNPGGAPFASGLSREDVFAPCRTNVYSFCGGTCTATLNKNWVPRLFHEGNYTVNAGAGLTQPDIPAACPALDSSINVTGLSCFQKTLLAGAPPEAIQYIWAKQVSGRWQVAIAQSSDGTLWELFRNDNTTRGVELASMQTPATTPPSWQNPLQLPLTGSNATYNLDKYSNATGCTNANPACAASVDVIFFVDQKNPSQTGFTTYDKDLLVTTLTSTSFSNVNARFGVSFSGGSSNPVVQQYVPTALASATSVSTNIQSYFTSFPIPGGSLDFATMIKNTMVQYWCGGILAQCTAPATNANPRVLVVTAHGADTGGATTTWETVWNLYSLLQVTVYVEAVGNATLSANTALLANITNGKTNQIMFWPYEVMLSSDDKFLYRRVCPKGTSPCNCGGFCSCSGSSMICTCPSCSSFDACNPASCSTPSLGCQVVQAQQVVCNPSDLCHSSVCVDSNGPLVAGGTPSCTNTVYNCTSSNLCKSAYCNPSVGCQEQLLASPPAVCVLGDPCMTYSCDPSLNSNTGACVQTPVQYSVAHPTCGTNPCLLTGGAYPCSAGDVCNPVTCIQSGSQCTSLVPAANQPACLAQFNVSNVNATGYYCSVAPLNCSASNDACNAFSCNVGSGGCVSTPVTCSQTDICSTKTCNVTTGGCSPGTVTANNPGTVCAAVACKVPTCVIGSNVCTFTNSTTLACACTVGSLCPSNTNCTLSDCYNTATQCNSITNTTAQSMCLGSIGSNQRYCYTRPKTCPPNTQCTTYTCNPSSGNCDATAVSCNDGDICSFDSCATQSCVSTNLTAAQLSSVCPPQACKIASCVRGSNSCVFTDDLVNCGQCAISNPTIPASSFCFSWTCVDSKTLVQCSDLVPSQQAACAASLGAPGYYVGKRALSPCPPDDFCTSYACQDSGSSCIASARSCSPPNQCFISSCDVASSSCLNTPLSQVSVNALCNPPPCTIASCVGGVCNIANDTSLACACVVGTSCQALVADTFCTTTSCMSTTAECNAITNVTASSQCLAAISAGSRYCYVAPKASVCPAGDFCLSYQCTTNASSPTTGWCAQQTASCGAASNMCQKRVCTGGACQTVDLSPVEQATICSDGNVCTDDFCLSANGFCTHQAAVSPPPQCVQCTNSSCPGGTLCSPNVCFKSCTDPVVRNVAACFGAVAANGIYCEAQPVTCPADDFCSTWSCNAATGICQSTTRDCSTGAVCQIGQCSTQAGACVVSDPCLGVSFGSQPCLQPQCQVNASAPQGFACFGPASPARDCTDYFCSGTSIQSQIVIGGSAKNEFLANYAAQSAVCVSIVCTADSCDPGDPNGCVNLPLTQLQVDTLCLPGSCQVASCSPSTGCVLSPKQCPSNTTCATYSCNSTSGNCDVTPIPCNDGDKCTTDSCATQSCVSTNLTTAELASVCPAQTCKTAACPRGSNVCSYANDFVACGACTIFSPTIPSGSFCYSSLCIDAKSTVVTCSSLVAADQAPCVTALAANGNTGYFVGRIPKVPSPCSPNDVCSTYLCNDIAGNCSRVDTICSARNMCESAACSVAGGGCVYTPSSCQPNTTCATYVCNLATGVCDATSIPCNDGDKCTFDSCASGSCIFTSLSGAQLASVCPPQTCKISSCVVGSNACTYVDAPSCAGCTSQNPTIPGATFCYQSTCVDNVSMTKCADLVVADQAACTAVNDTSNSWAFVGRLSLSPGPCPQSDQCKSYQCNDTLSTCPRSDTVCTPRFNCETAACDVVTGCVYTPKTCPANTQCTSYKCSNATGICDPTPVPCNDGDKCTSDSCATQSCVSTNLTTSELASVCPALTCKTALCARGSNACSYVNDFATCGACTIFNPTIPASSFCYSSVCVDAKSVAITCSSLIPADQAACVTAVMGNGYFVGHVPVVPSPCPASDACRTYTCNNTAGVCDMFDTGATCSTADICLVASCDPVSGCVALPKNAAVIQVLCDDASLCTTDSCASSACVHTPSVTCPANTLCSSFSCNATTGNCDASATVGICNDNSICTFDSCSDVLGCTYTTLTLAQLDSVCPPQPGQTVSCVSNACMYTPVSTTTATNGPATTTTLTSPTTTTTDATTTPAPTSTTVAPTSSTSAQTTSAVLTTTATTLSSTSTTTMLPTTTTPFAPTTFAATTATMTATTQATTVVISTTTATVFRHSVAGSAQVFQGGDDVNDPVKFTFVITNTGNAALSGLAMTVQVVAPAVQSNLSAIQCAGALVGSSTTPTVQLPGQLPPGSVITCTTTYALADASSTMTSVVVQVQSASAPTTNLTVSGTRPVCSGGCSCGCKNGEELDVTSGLCAKICKDKQHCCWLSQDRSCNDRPALCDTHPEQLYDKTACDALINSNNNNNNGGATTAPDATTNYCDWDNNCRSANEPAICNTVCPTSMIQGCVCNSTDTGSCQVTSSKVVLPANSAVALPRCDLSGGNNWTVPVSSALSCGVTVVDNATAFELFLASSQGSALHLGHVVTTNGTVLVNLFSRPGGSSRRRVVQTVELVSYDSVQGNFQVKVVPDYVNSACDTVQSSVFQSSSSLSATLAVDPISPAPYGCPGGPVFQTWQIVVLCCGLMLLLTVGLVVLILLLLRRRRALDIVRNQNIRNAETMEMQHMRSSGLRDVRLPGNVRHSGAYEPPPFSGEIVLVEQQPPATAFSVSYEGASARVLPADPEATKAEYLASRVPSSSPRE